MTSFSHPYEIDDQPTKPLNPSDMDQAILAAARASYAALIQESRRTSQVQPVFAPVRAVVQKRAEMPVENAVPTPPSDIARAKRLLRLFSGSSPT